MAAPTQGFPRGLGWLLLGVSVVLLVGIIYAPALHAPFVFDDLPNIQDNLAIRLTTLSLTGLWQAMWQSEAVNRPVANLSFALNYYVHGSQVWGYHVVNVAIHLATGLLLGLFVATTLRTPALRGRTPAPGWLAPATALLWLVHPLHTQSVTYIVQRMTSLAALFYLVALVLYARARLSASVRARWGLGVGCVVSGLLALGSKEIAATLPLALLLYEWYFVQDLRPAWLTRAGLLLAVVAVGVVLGLAWLYPQGQGWAGLVAGYETRDFTLGQRVLTEWRVVWLYLRLLAWPHPSQLTLDYDFAVSRSLFSPPTTVLALAGLLGLVGLTVALARKERVVSFCLGWFVLQLVMESSVINLELVFEHRTYLPSLMLSWLVVTLVARYVPRLEGRVGVLGLVVVVWAVWTYERNQVWANAETLWRDCVAKSPHKARPHTNLGVVLAQQGRTAEALVHYTEALRLQPTFAQAHYNLGLLLAQQGKTAEALAHYTEALRLQPTYVEAHNNLGMALAQQGKLAEAIAHYTEALRLQPTLAETHYNLGIVLAQQGKLAEAIVHYTEALRLQPTYAAVHNNLGSILTQQGKLAEAISHYSEALRLQPTNAGAHNNLGMVLAQQGKLPEAIARYTEALRLQPTLAAAHYNLGSVLAQQGKLTEASSRYTEALRLQPTYAAAHYNLGMVLAQQGKLTEAMTHYTEALRLQPTSADAHYHLGLLWAQQGQRAQAMAALTSALRYRPHWPPAAAKLAGLLATQPQPSPQDLAEAVRLAEGACQATQYRDATVLYTLAVVYRAAGRPAEALQTAQQALARAQASGQEPLVRQIQEGLAGFE